MVRKEPKYKIDGKGCWIWQLFRDEDGYGIIKIKGKTLKAHRYFYELIKKKIEKGKILDHLCNTPSCVNPEHLKETTIKENLRRGKHIKLNKKLINQITVLYPSLNQYELAKKFNLNQSTISRIIYKKRWN